MQENNVLVFICCLRVAEVCYSCTHQFHLLLSPSPLCPLESWHSSHTPIAVRFWHSYLASTGMILLSQQNLKPVKTLVIKPLHQGSRSWSSAVAQHSHYASLAHRSFLPSPPTLPDMCGLILHSTVLPCLLLFSLSPLLHTVRSDTSCCSFLFSQ